MEEMELLPNLIKVAVGGLGVGGGGWGETANPCFVARVKTRHAFSFDGCGVATVFVDPPPHSYTSIMQYWVSMLQPTVIIKLRQMGSNHNLSVFGFLGFI